MKACPKMQAVIQQLAQKHGIDLADEGAVLQLDMAGYDTLFASNTGGNCVVVAHYREDGGYVQPDPEIVFFVNSASRWVPIRVTMVIGGLRAHARLSEDSNEITQIDPAGQADLADFVEETWALNLELQDWLEYAELRPKEQQIRRGSPSMLFPLGSVVATPGALAALETAEQTPREFLDRHVAGDWGNLPKEDADANERALIRGGRVFSGYDLATGNRMWIITESDRSSTCLLLPAEY